MLAEMDILVNLNKFELFWQIWKFLTTLHNFENVFKIMEKPIQNLDSEKCQLELGHL